MQYKCKLCKTEHDNPEDAIDCHLACLVPKLKKLYIYGIVDEELEKRKVIALESIDKSLYKICTKGIGVKK